MSSDEKSEKYSDQQDYGAKLTERFIDGVIEELVRRKAQALAVTAVEEAFGTPPPKGMINEADHSTRERSEHTAAVLARLLTEFKEFGRGGEQTGLEVPKEEVLAERAKTVPREQAMKANPQDPAVITLGNEGRRAELILRYLDGREQETREQETNGYAQKVREKFEDSPKGGTKEEVGP